MDMLAVLIPLFPALAAICIGLGQFTGILSGIRSEAVTARLACGAVYISALLSIVLLLFAGSGNLQGEYIVGQWIDSGNFSVTLNFQSTGTGVTLAALFSLLFVVIFRFSRNYLHSEQGFHRFFAFLCLFVFSMYLLLLSGNVLVTFLGWELAGFCSFMLIAFAWHRDNASRNACMVFITNRVGDAFFILGAVLCYSWMGTLDWADIKAGIGSMPRGQENLIAFSFLLAAAVKSAQFPFTWWLNRSMEGPTPSSAVFYGAIMVHAGVFLLIMLAPVMESAPVISMLAVAIGVMTFLYSVLSVQTQVDIKSSLGFSTSAQLGLMFIECGLGLWTLALLHLCVHAVVRSYLYLTAPSILHNVHGFPVKPVTLSHPFMRRLSLASLHDFWLENHIRSAFSRPCLLLARDLANLDDNVVDPIMGFPTTAIRSTASLAFQEEQKIGARLEGTEDNFSSGSGLAGKLTAAIAAITGWFEHHFVLEGVEKNLPEAGRRLGHLANNLETMLLRPRYLVLFITVTLLFTL